MMYNKIVHDCFFFPRHIGILDCSIPRTVYFRVGHFSQNTIIDLYMQCDSARKVIEVCYKTNGNPYLIAALEWLCRQTNGKNFDELHLNQEELIKLLEIPTNQTPLILYVKDVYTEVLNLMSKSFQTCL